MKYKTYVEVANGDYRGLRGYVYKVNKKDRSKPTIALYDEEKRIKVVIDTSLLKVIEPQI
jgi:ribosomal protein L24